MKQDAEFTKLTANLLSVAQGFCGYGEAKGLITPEGLKLAVGPRRELVMLYTKAGKSQREIAKELGVPRRTVRDDVSGRKPPRNGRKPPTKKAALERTAAWTDEEIEAETGSPLSTPAQDIQNDFLGLVRVALTVKSLDLSDVKITAAMKAGARNVVDTWTKLMEEIDA